MGLIFKFDDNAEKMQPDDKITFGSLDFIAEQRREDMLILVLDHGRKSRRESIGIA